MPPAWGRRPQHSIPPSGPRRPFIVQFRAWIDASFSGPRRRRSQRHSPCGSVSRFRRDPAQPESHRRLQRHLLGGNLTVLTTIIGSPFLPAWDGAILFCEDVGEEYYRVDRMLTQLKLAGVLAKIAGFVFGTCSECRPGDSSFGALSVHEIFVNHIKRLDIPAWSVARIR